jgi:primosomal protein N' (replication factor Y)
LKYADVILPLSIPQSYTFGVPLELQDDIKVGCRVEVQFGQRKIYSGLVKRLHNEKPDIYAVKPIRSLLDLAPVVNAQQLKFWEWIASYYACAEGDVMNAALPSHLKLVSETCVVLNEDVSIDANELTDDEFLLLQALDIKRNQQDIK